MQSASGTAKCQCVANFKPASGADAACAVDGGGGGFAGPCSCEACAAGRYAVCAAETNPPGELQTLPATCKASCEEGGFTCSELIPGKFYCACPATHYRA